MQCWAASSPSRSYANHNSSRLSCCYLLLVDVDVVWFGLVVFVFVVVFIYALTTDSVGWRTLRWSRLCTTSRYRQTAPVCQARYKNRRIERLICYFVLSLSSSISIADRYATHHPGLGIGNYSNSNSFAIARSQVTYMRHSQILTFAHRPARTHLTQHGARTAFACWRDSAARGTRRSGSRRCRRCSSLQCASARSACAATRRDVSR